MVNSRRGMVKDMFNIGDWVKYDSENGRHGFVTEVLSENLYKVYIPALKRNVLYKAKNIVPFDLPFSNEEQAAINKVMADLALDTKDEEWFKEVTK